MDFWPVVILLIAAGAAGWVDAVVGGGGLLQLPALLLAAPGMPVATALGTNKMSSIAGTVTAAVTYLRSTKVDKRVVWPAAALAVAGSAAGAALAGAMSSGALRPIILAALIAVAVFVTFKPNVGLVVRPERDTPTRRILAIAVAGLAIATYDGLVGPGTGTFLIIAFTTILGTDFLQGSAMAKVINAGTNLGALLVFVPQGHVDWKLGLGMAACNVIGARLGARTAIRRGAGFVRIVLMVVVGALVLKLIFV
ncbi:sulfite exporter TauE/SafE family protein [Longispora albida]|uniref:sulfite exporter TauE/SafE family protein n=1 Tax=Longispora albida TaxID=203523 RepID=UPI0003667480|nr:TSUP family transporter [Longispora albida]